MKTLEAKAYLDSFINFENNLNDVSRHTFKLDRVNYLLSLFENPHKKLKCVHVAGSKAKGSVCAMTAQILKEAGYKVGLYTSPHINNYNERIRILSFDQPVNIANIFADAIKDEKLAELITSRQSQIEKAKEQAQYGRLSFFEVFTALAFDYFEKEKCDIVVLETGLGGRLDATNVCDSLVSVITPISLEHQHILGNTLKEIATEKAAIIKESTKQTVVAPQDPKVRDVIQKRCAQMNVEMIEVSGGESAGYELALHGEHQKVNACVVLKTVWFLQEHQFVITEEAIRRGLKNVFWPLRFEVIGRESNIVLDGAHTRESARALGETLKAQFPGRRVVLIMGMSNDKNPIPVAEELNKVSDEIILTKASHPRAADLNEWEMCNVFRGKRCIKIPNVQEALNVGLTVVSEEDVLVIAGSLFLASQARGLLCTN